MEEGFGGGSSVSYAPPEGKQHTSIYVINCNPVANLAPPSPDSRFAGEQGLIGKHYMSEIFSSFHRVLLGFSILLGTSTWVDVLGMVAGHSYYFLEDVYPRMTGRRPLKTPAFIKSLFSEENVVVTRQANAIFAPPPQDPHQD